VGTLIGTGIGGFGASTNTSAFVFDQPGAEKFLGGNEVVGIGVKVPTFWIILGPVEPTSLFGVEAFALLISARSGTKIFTLILSLIDFANSGDKSNERTSSSDKSSGRINPNNTYPANSAT